MTVSRIDGFLSESHILYQASIEPPLLLFSHYLQPDLLLFCNCAAVIQPTESHFTEKFTVLKEIKNNQVIVCFYPPRIIAMCGDYYIGGRRFSSLSDLIGYYSYVSCLLKGEKLLTPVAPPEVRVIVSEWTEYLEYFV